MLVIRKITNLKPIVYPAIVVCTHVCQNFYLPIKYKTCHLPKNPLQLMSVHTIGDTDSCIEK